MECTFTSAPKPRHRLNAHPSKETGKPVDTSTSLNRNASHAQFSKVSLRTFGFLFLQGRSDRIQMTPGRNHNPRQLVSHPHRLLVSICHFNNSLPKLRNRRQYIHGLFNRASVKKKNRQLGLLIQTQARNQNSLENGTPPPSL